MCLILFAFKVHPDYDLVLLANRDEFYTRPTEQVHFWDDSTNLLAGKDLRSGGTWLGVTRDGRFAAVTNFSGYVCKSATSTSRGKLVSSFLEGFIKAEDYLENIVKSRDNYDGFSLILGDRKRIYYYSNFLAKKQKLSPGIYGISNHLLDTPWPKIIWGKKLLKEYISNEEGLSVSDAFKILSSRIPDGIRFPERNTVHKWERELFIESPDYGTRSSSVLFIGKDNRVIFTEKSYDPKFHNDPVVKHTFKIMVR